MRISLPLVPALLLCSCVPALAQVTVNLRALDALPHLPPAAAAPAPHPRRPSMPRSVAGTGAAATAESPPVHGPPRKVTTMQPGKEAQTARHAPTNASAPRVSATARSSAVPVPSAATLPSAPPPVATLAPPGGGASARTPQAGTPPKPPVVAGAATSAAPDKTGLQLVFAKGQSDLSPASADAIKGLAKAAPDSDATTFNVLAYASGDPNDPSVARRLSLSRAIAVRDALMADGVPSARIYLRALGAQPGNGGPPDRVDVNVSGNNPTSSAAQQ